MVAPTRVPQARGAKCDLCKRILATATWLDQTKLAKTVEEAETVLDLIRQHDETSCPCIPKSIQNLLLGSTYFEMHRLLSRQLDNHIHKRQVEHFIEAKKKSFNESLHHQHINDCNEISDTTRFKLYADQQEPRIAEKSEKQFDYLSMAIDIWTIAFEDQANPFNSKLALRLGLTHHVIYACYLFKYHNVLDKQLKAANLLLNLFRTIEGVTANAVIHAHYLLIRTLIDCDQIHQARQCLKNACKMSNYQDKTRYESILLATVDGELKLLDHRDSFNPLNDLESLTQIQPDDKLQHYYARTLAASIILKYIHYYPARSELCSEFYRTFRLICAIIRRCYEDSFELVLSEKEAKKATKNQEDVQILDHSWIRYAACDFAFSTFSVLSEFYMRAGQPESLELLYNGLELIAHRNSCRYWQGKIALIGADLDLICDKYQHARDKINAVSKTLGYTKDTHMMNLLRLDQEASLMALLHRENTVITRDVFTDLLDRIISCKTSLLDSLTKLDLYDCKSNTSFKPSNTFESDDALLVTTGCLGQLSFRVFKVAIRSMMRFSDQEAAYDLMKDISTRDLSNLQYNQIQILLETLLQFAEIEKTEQILLSTIESSGFTYRNDCTLESKMSTLTLDSNHSSSSRSTKGKTRATKPKLAQISFGRKSRRRGYDVANQDETCSRLCGVLDALRNFQNLSQEEMISCFLRYSEPNPDYLLYRRAHELMFCIRSRESHPDRSRLLFHFCESASANTMRYRWMMYEEQQLPLDKPSTSGKSQAFLKYLGFSNNHVNQENIIKNMVKSIPENSRLVQIKYILDEHSDKEYLIIANFDKENEPVFAYVPRDLSSSNDFFTDIQKSGERIDLSLISKFFVKIEESKKILISGNVRSRNQNREKVESEVSMLLHDLESEWLGALKFLILGKIRHAGYNQFVQDTVADVLKIMSNYTCISISTLGLLIENAALLSRDEFCHLTSALFNSTPFADDTRECFIRWSKSLEAFIASQSLQLSKSSFLQSLPRGPVGFILANDLESIPFESLPTLRISKQPVFRIPSLRIYSMLSSRHLTCTTINPNRTAFLLDPANNLQKTRERFESKLRIQKKWTGSVGEPPKVIELEKWLTEQDLYIFMGHGAGSTYYKHLCKGRGLSSMTSIRAAALVIGCSSGRIVAEGPNLERFGVAWIFILRGAPVYVGLLWDVTDTDIDRFTDSLLSKFLGQIWSKEGGSILNLTDAVAQAKHVCQFKFLVGATPVVYGIPIQCQS